MTQTRPTWDQTWLGVAHVLAYRSLCSRAQVGAVIVSSDNRILASGYNGPPRGFEHASRPCVDWCSRGRAFADRPSPEYDDCPSLHAEANAISVCDHPARAHGTLFVTSHVCYGCAKLVANSGISRVVVDSDGDRSYRNPKQSYDLLQGLGIEVVIR